MTVPRRPGGPAGHRVERSNAGCSHAAGWRLRAARCDAVCARRAGDRACRWATSATGPSRPSRRPSWHLSHVHHSPLSRTAGPPDRLGVQRALTVDAQILGGRDLDSIYTVTVLESLDYPDTNRQPICSHSYPHRAPVLIENQRHPLGGPVLGHPQRHRRRIVNAPLPGKRGPAPITCPTPRTLPGPSDTDRTKTARPQPQTATPAPPPCWVGGGGQQAGGRG